MIAQFNQNHLLFTPLTYHNPIASQNPCSVFVQIRSFRRLKITHLPKVYLVDSMRSSNFSSRVSRFARTEAQEVLLDYFHSTRGYSFVDAEYMSKNSPHFLQSLVFRFNGHEDVARSLKKFLRYNAINEFEPFFESLGINPSELNLVLPPGMMFLTDDYVMLENFHALCDYGVPRNRMGKMYKVGKEIFGYRSGLLSSKFRAYENLGLSKSTVIKLVSCCPSLLIGDINCEFATVLDWLKRIGFQNDWIGNYVSCTRTYNWKKMLDTIDFLHNVGCSGKQLHNLFKENPALLLEGSGKKVYLLVRLLKLGLKMSVFYSSFIQNPQNLSNKCVKNLLRVVDFLYNIGMESEDIASILSKHMQLLSLHPLKGSKTVCGGLNVGRADLCQIIKDDPLKLISLASKLEQKRTELQSRQDLSIHIEKTTFLLRLGYVENSEEMAKALKRFRGRGDQLQERFDCLVEAGLDYSSVIEMIKRAPMILNQTKDIIVKKLDCLINNIGYPLECVTAFPAYLCYDLERINKRFLMYAWLRKRNVVKPNLTLSTILASSDERFVKYFVDVDPEGPTIWESLKNLSTSR